MTDMTETRAWKLKLLGQMVDHVIGLTAKPGKSAKGKPFSSQKISEAIVTSPSNWTNMKRGERPINVERLGQLTHHLGLDLYGLSYEIFLLPTIEAFKARLAACNVGRGGYFEAYDEARRTIIASWESSFAGQSGIHLKKVKLRTRGGLGYPIADVSGTQLLSSKDTIVVEIHHPENGHLVLLNDDVTLNEVTCLAPSCYAPTSAVKGRLTSIPTKDGALPAIPVNGSVNGTSERRYRLYALWSAIAPVHLDFVKRAAANVGIPAQLSIAEFQEFAGYVRQQEATAARRHQIQLLVANYYVEPSPITR